MSMVGNLAKVLAPAALLIASTSFAHDVLVPADPVTIKNIKTNGSGCPLGTVSQNISDDKQAFTLSFSEFVAETGPDLSPSLGRKNCVVTLNLKVPVGWQYSVGSFNYRGYMGLEDGIKAAHTTTYFFEGNSKQGKFQATKFGPYDSEFLYTDKIGLESVEMPDTWSECTKDRALSINTSIVVSNYNKTKYPNARGLITNDTQDGEITQVFGLTWRRCQ